MFKRYMTVAAAIVVVWCGEALAGPTSQILAPSTDAKAYKEARLGIVNIVSAADYSAPGYPPVPGGKPAFTTRLQICLP